MILSKAKQKQVSACALLAFGCHCDSSHAPAEAAALREWVAKHVQCLIQWARANR